MDEIIETPIVKDNFFEKNATAIATGAAVLGMAVVSAGYLVYLKKNNAAYQDFLTKQNKAYTTHLENVLKTVLNQPAETLTK